MSVRELVRQHVERSKFPPDRSLDSAETQGFVPSLMITEFRGIEPFLRHFDKRGTKARIGDLPRQG